MQCDMCGKDAELYLTRIEGTELSVCKSCSSFGTIISQPKKKDSKYLKKKPAKKDEPEIIESVVENYPQLVKNKREKLGLKQEELAAKLAERTSLLQKIETGNFTPSLQMAGKIEKHLGIKLIEKIETKSEQQIQKAKGKKLTIGDVIKLK